MIPRSRLVVPIVLAALLVAPIASAEPTDLERGRALFDEAGELERQGQWPAARDRLRAALRIRETPHLHYALGWALENDAHLLEARTEYEVALRLASTRVGLDDVKRLAAARIQEVDRKIPLVQVHVKGALAKDTHVFVDGREVIVHGDVGTIPVDPGARVVRVERAGKPSSDETVTVTPGVFRVVDIDGDESRAPDRKSSSALPWVLVGGGGALAATGVMLLISASGDASTQDEHTKQALGAVLGTVGVASIAVGAYTLVRVNASPVPGGAMASATITF